MDDDHENTDQESRMNIHKSCSRISCQSFQENALLLMKLTAHNVSQLMKPTAHRSARATPSSLPSNIFRCTLPLRPEPTPPLPAAFQVPIHWYVHCHCNKLRLAWCLSRFFVLRWSTIFPPRSADAEQERPNKFSGTCATCVCPGAHATLILSQPRPFPRTRRQHKLQRQTSDRHPFATYCETAHRSTAPQSSGVTQHKPPRT